MIKSKIEPKKGKEKHITKNNTKGNEKNEKKNSMKDIKKVFTPQEKKDKDKEKQPINSKKEKTDKNNDNKKDHIKYTNHKPGKPAILLPKKNILPNKKPMTKITYIDEPDKPQILNKYIHGVVQLEKQNIQFTDQNFQKIRHVSFCSYIIMSFRRIGMCLNKVDIAALPRKPIKKVLFIVINSNNDVGCCNDAYLISLIHMKLGFKIVYLYNTNLVTLIKFLGYFLEHTISAFTFYYTGHDSASKIRNVGHGIKFIDKSCISDQELGKFIAEKSNGKEFILVLSDCDGGGSVFNMETAVKSENKSLSDIVCFKSHKSKLTPDAKIRTHGLFTYYFCKLIKQFPTLSPKDMEEKLNESMARFNISFSYETSENGDRLSDDIIFEDADTSINGPNAEITGASKRAKIPEPKHLVEAIPIELQEKQE